MAPFCLRFSFVYNILTISRGRFWYLYTISGFGSVQKRIKLRGTERSQSELLLLGQSWKKLFKVNLSVETRAQNKSILQVFYYCPQSCYMEERKVVSRETLTALRTSMATNWDENPRVRMNMILFPWIQLDPFSFGAVIAHVATGTKSSEKFYTNYSGIRYAKY